MEPLSSIVLRPHVGHGGACLQATKLFSSFEVDFESLIQLLPAGIGNPG